MATLAPCQTPTRVAMFGAAMFGATRFGYLPCDTTNDAGTASGSRVFYAGEYITPVTYTEVQR